MNQYYSKVVVDLGSGSIRSGIGCDDFPLSVVPSVIGRIKKSSDNAETILKGRESIVDLNYPIQRGIISDLDSLEIMLQHIIHNELQEIIPEQYPLIIGYSPMNLRRTKVGLAEIAFEKIHNPVVCLVNRAVLSIFASGRTCGLIIQSGEGVTHSVPISEGSPLNQFSHSLDFGGIDLTQFMEQLINQWGYTFVEKFDSKGIEHVKQIKEKMSKLSLNYGFEEQRWDICHKHYEIHDEIISLGIEQYKCPEALFQPSLVGKPEQCGIHELIIKSLSHFETDSRKNLERNIILAGGNTLIHGLGVRIEKELEKTDNSNRCMCNSPADRHLSSWIGGSVISSLRNADSICITKEEFQECGSSIIHRRNL